MRVLIGAASALLCLFLAVAVDASELPRFLEKARDADVVILGEIHDNPTHHATQAEIVAALRPAVYVKGGDWQTGAQRPPEAAVALANGGRVEYIAYLAGRSTSEILAHIRADAAPRP